MFEIDVFKSSQGLLKCVKDGLGRHIDRVDLFECCEQWQRDAIAMLLDGAVIRRMEIIIIDCIMNDAIA